jgi:hypothetical protein
MVIMNQSSAIPVTLKASWNALLGSDTLLKLTHLSLPCTSSQTLAWSLAATEINIPDVVTVQETVAEISLAYLRINAGNSLRIDICNQAPHRLP